MKKTKTFVHTQYYFVSLAQHIKCVQKLVFFCKFLFYFHVVKRLKL